MQFVAHVYNGEQILRMLYKMLGKLKRWLERRAKNVRKGIMVKVHGVKHIPTVLSIALTNRCNANCIYCRREYRTVNPDMDFDFYKKVIDSMPFIEEVQPQINGEPLSHPRILDVIVYAKDYGKRVVLYTNGTYLSPDISDCILETQLDKIVFSVDECEEARFEAIRRKNTWKRVLGNIEMFQAKRNAGDYKTKTVLRICITPENRNRIGKIKKFWAGRVDEIVATPEMYMPSSNEIKVGGYVSGKPIKCHTIYDNIAIETNGDLLLCCNDFFDSFNLGNLHDVDSLTPEAVLDLYNSVEFNWLREALLTGKNYSFKCHVCQGRSDLVLERDK